MGPRTGLQRPRVDLPQVVRTVLVPVLVETMPPGRLSMAVVTLATTRARLMDQEADMEVALEVDLVVDLVVAEWVLMMVMEPGSMDSISRPLRTRVLR